MSRAPQGKSPRNGALAGGSKLHSQLVIQNSSSKECDVTDDTSSSLAELVHIEAASTSDSDSSDIQDKKKVPTGITVKVLKGETIGGFLKNWF